MMQFITSTEDATLKELIRKDNLEAKTLEYYQSNTHQYAEACLLFEDNRKEVEKQMKSKK